MQDSSTEDFPTAESSSGSRTDVTVYVPFKDPAPELFTRVVDAILGQSYPIREVLLVDDGSFSQETAELLGGYGSTPKIRVIRHPRNWGVASARNTAVRHAAAPLVCSFDADIIPDTNCVERLVGRIEADPRIGGVGGRVREFYSDTPGDRFRGIFMKQDRGEEPLLDIDLFGGCTLYRIEALKKVAGYVAPLRNSFEDFDVSQRVRTAGWQTAYEPAATGWHHKRDSVRSALNTLFRWSYSHWEGASWIFEYDWLTNPAGHEPPEFYYEETVCRDVPRVAFKINRQLGVNLAQVRQPGLTDEQRFLAGVFVVHSILSDLRLFERHHADTAESRKREFLAFIQNTVFAVLRSEPYRSLGPACFSLVGDLLNRTSLDAGVRSEPADLLPPSLFKELPPEALALSADIIEGLRELPSLIPEDFQLRE